VETSPTPTAQFPQADLPRGAVVGEYRIERKLKQGGMGTVYEAVHQVIDKRAAVKVLKRELCENGEALHRFVQEARAVNQINHPNIVDVFGFGVTDDGRSWLAMELLVGETLGERMTRAPLSRAETCEVLIEITHALEAAHARGVVHRDLKPDNVFLAAGRGGPVVKLLDFGIAKLTGGAGMNGPVDVTQPGTLIGTPKYIAPEQARGLAIDGSADVYALGVMAFEMLTGRPPFMANDPVELIAKHITLRPPAPSDFAPTLPLVADALVGEMLDKHPPSRPSLVRIREQLAELRTAPDARDSTAALRRPETTVVSAMPARPSATIVDTPPAPPRRRWWLVPAGLAVVAIGVRIAVGVLDRGGDDPPPPPPPPASEAPAPEVAAPAPVVTPIAPPADAAEPIEMDPEQDSPVEPAIEIDPSPTKRIPKRPVRTKPSETKPSETKPPETKPTDIKPADRPKPREDRDGLRDPFHH
jgi:serine/threonine-protein kinase